jgi:hypothetical protein
MSRLADLLNNGATVKPELERAHTALARAQHKRAQQILDDPDPRRRTWRWENALRGAEGREPVSWEEWVR